MLLSIKHQTELSYSDYIKESVIELRMAPMQETQQHRLSFELAIGPSSKVKSYFDWLGNWVHVFSINPLHNQIQIIASSVVETGSPTLTLDALPDLWRKDAEYDWTHYDFLQFGGPVVDTTILRELAGAILRTASSKGPNVRVGDLATVMLSKISEFFVYEKGVTSSASPITEILAHRRGVCQDFAHLMIGLTRALNIPARYVSGYIHNEKSAEFRGSAQSHAWVEIFVPSTGWVALDPTNNCLVGENFVKVATGRNFSDVPPNKGVYKGAGSEKIEVSVKTERLASVPAELVAERTMALSMPVFAGSIDEQIQQLRQQHEQHQQQQQQQ
jgi:transglutaminase-like putative cysteine protease